jgi:predicted permease
MTATIDGRVERARGALAAGNYFHVIGARIQMGRPLTPEDDRTPGAHPVAVISDGFWRRSFAADPAVLGRGIRLNKQTFTIVGVAGRGFSGAEVGSPIDVWVPLVMQREVGRDFLTDARTNWLEIIGRLQSGSRERAAAELTAFVDRTLPGVLARRASRASTTDPHQLVLLRGNRGTSALRRELGPALRVLVALAGLALMLTCINVASLLVVRSVAREKEIAVRLALGARRSDLVRQFLTETFVLAALGGIGGLFMAPWAAGLLVASQPDRLGIDATPDLRVFLFGLLAWIVTGILVGQAPILASSKVGLAQAAGNQSGAPSGTRRRVTLHDAIVTAQIAASLVMLIGAALFVQSLKSLGALDPGFPAERLLLVSVDPGSAGYEGPRLESFWRTTLERVDQIHGVESASLARIVPLAYGRERQPVLNSATGESPEIDVNAVGPRYFATLGVPLVRGREFTTQDGRTAPRVAIVNEQMARTFWPGQDAVGKPIALGPKGGAVGEVVGVVRDVKYRDLKAEAGPMFYVPLFQSSTSDPMTVHVRAASDPGALASTIRREIQVLDPRLPIFEIRTLDEQLNASFAQTRQAAVMTGGFGVLALLLSAVGVYGVTALAVSRQTHDIGVRMALGAQPRHIVRAMGGHGVKIVLAGVALGLVGAYGFVEVADALLYGITPLDAAAALGTASLLPLMALIAVYIPARGATRLDAVTAIRRE